jgi:type IV secretory pathway VirB2 component (pilin)
MKRLTRFAPYLFIALTIAVAFMPATALASAGAGGGLPYEDWLDKIRASATGPVAFTVSIVAMVGAGSMLIFQAGELSGFLRTMLYIALVMALLVGAQNMMSGFFGKGAEIALTPSIGGPRLSATISSEPRLALDARGTV